MADNEAADGVPGRSRRISQAWGQASSAARLAAALVLAVPAASVVAVVVAVGVWWFVHAFFSIERAVSCGVTMGALVAASIAALAAPAGRARRTALAVVCGLWGAGVVGWVGAVLTNPMTEEWYPHTRWWMAFAAAGFVSFGVPALVVAWWRWVPLRYRWSLPIVVAAAVLVLPLVPGWWLWGASAHFGTAGEASPGDAVTEWVDDAIILGEPTPGSDIRRLECDDSVARRQLDGYIASWKPYLTHHRWQVTADWSTGHVDHVSSSRALVTGTLTVHTAYGDVFLDEPSHLRFTTTHSWDGWRVCGFSVPGASAGSSATPTPHPTPRTASPSPSVVNPAPPTAMAKCGADDPYRSMGWYTCPPTPTTAPSQ